MRSTIRLQSSAKVKLQEIADKECILKDLSITGCKIECSFSKEIIPNKQFTLQIVPERASEVAPFIIVSESKWVNPGEKNCEVGFSIVESPKGKQFQRYVEYLSWRSSQGISITGTA